jgi:phospholipid-translocating ATPase
MIFRQCSVGGKIYISDEEPKAPEGESQKDDVKKTTSDSSDSASDTEANNALAQGDEVKPPLPKEVLARFHSAQLDRDLGDHDSEHSRVLHGFFAVLGLCHTVLAAETAPGVIEYKAQSPDEAALVQSAADVGFVFRGRDHNIVKLSTPFSEEPDEYELLHVLEFNSTRKRMSVILRKLDQDGRLFLLTKGADNIIFDRLAKDGAQKELREKTDKDLQYFASEGLRTLCLAYRVLDDKEYEQWARDYHEASVALSDRESRVEEVSARIETDLLLLGATAIEDKLQDGVPEAISDLKRAGIKVWVATGDKLETAVAIGYTTHLLTPETNLIIVREGLNSVKDQISDALETFFGEEGLAVARTISRASVDLRPRLDRVNTGVRSLVGGDNGLRPGGFSLVIEGHALAHAFDDEETNDLLLALSTRCNTVICCRVSPLQKAQIVRLIKDNLGVMCLAIGDGANDVSMIQAADVGVGISGEEGLQAVNSSDYAIAQFRFLNRLLFVHGHWSYYRNSSMILNFFYKNIIGIGVLFWYMIYCGWSTTYVFSYTYLLFWNVFWTLCPVIAIGLFDRNSDADVLMALPELYRFGRQQKYFGMRQFVYYLLEGWYQSAVIYFFLHFTYITTSARGDGWDVYIYEMSTTMAIGAVMVANFFHGLNIDAWNWWTMFAILIGPFLVWVYTAIYSIIPPSSFYTGVYGNDVFLFRSAAFWFGWPYVLVVALLPRYLIRTFEQTIKPNDIEMMRLVKKYNPGIDPATHPLLGGKLQDTDDIQPSDLIYDPTAIENEQGEGDDIPMSQFDSGYNVNPSKNKSPLTAFKSRTSMQSQRYGGYAQPSSARGSAVDSEWREFVARLKLMVVSTGLSREPSRGFDFTVEEGGVAVSGSSPVPLTVY